MNLKNGKVFTSKFVNLLGPGPRLAKKRIYRTAVSQRLRHTGLDQCSMCFIGLVKSLLVLFWILD